MAEEAVEIPVSRDDNALAIKNPGSPVEWDVLILQDRRKVGRVERHRKHVDNFVVTEDRYPDCQDRPLQHRPGEEVRDVRLPRPDDTVDRLTVSLARGQ